MFPEKLQIRRWEDGRILSTSDMSQYAHHFGTPLMQVHRGDLHEMLYKRARDLGVAFQLGSKVVDYDTERPSIRLDSGEVVHADLVVAADGALGHNGGSDAAANTPSRY